MEYNSNILFNELNGRIKSPEIERRILYHVRAKSGHADVESLQAFQNNGYTEEEKVNLYCECIRAILTDNLAILRQEPGTVEVLPAETETADSSMAVVVHEPPPVATGILLKKHHDITMFASNDGARYAISGVHYHPVKKFMEATNGRILIRVPVVEEFNNEFPPVKGAGVGLPEECQIPPAALKKALANIPTKHNLPILECARLDTVKNEHGVIKATITATDLDDEQAVTSKSIDAQYPNTEQVVPKDPPKFKICLAPKYVKLIAEYAVKHATETSGIVMEFTDELSPMCFHIDIGNGQKASGVLMPMRLS